VPVKQTAYRLDGALKASFQAGDEAVYRMALAEPDQVIRTLPSFEKWKSSMIERPVEGHFTLTPPLPDRASLPKRLSDELEWIDLVPYRNTLLRLTVFPDGMMKLSTHPAGLAFGPIDTSKNKQ
jgi:hypothetical protein